jgi:predicted DNA binding CopG/RHH family protein
MKKNPRLTNGNAERESWARRKSSEYTGWSKANRAVAPKPKPSLKAISLRLPVSMIEELKLLAGKRDVPYQSLLKIFLAERIRKELRGAPEAE